MQKSYQKGRESMIESIKEIGRASSIEKFNSENPKNIKFNSLDAYYYAEGQIDVLIGKNRTC